MLRSGTKSQAYSSGSARNCSRIESILALPIIGLIYIYQYTLSSMLGNNCRFEPTCSNYGLDALRKYGAWYGSIIAAKRLLRCHPFHQGGYDPVE